jgi:hypothetical protein
MILPSLVSFVKFKVDLLVLVCPREVRVTYMAAATT